MIAAKTKWSLRTGLPLAAVLLVAEGPAGESARLALNLGDEAASVGGERVEAHSWLLLD